MSTIPASAAAATKPVPGAHDRAWYIVGRWEEYEGETRANVLRLAAVAAFYAIELTNYHGLDLGFIQLPKVSDTAFHQTVTAITGGLGLARRGGASLAAAAPHAGGAQIRRDGLGRCAPDPPPDGGRRSQEPAGCRVLFDSGPGDAAVPAPARLVRDDRRPGRLHLAAGMGAVWIEGVRDVRVPRYHELIFLTALAMSGIIQGQVIRRVKSLATEYARRQSAAGAAALDPVPSSPVGGMT